jgi:hypothetical protein
LLVSTDFRTTVSPFLPAGHETLPPPVVVVPSVVVPNVVVEKVVVPSVVVGGLIVIVGGCVTTPTVFVV